MIEILLGSLIGLFGFTEAVDTKPVAPGTVNITQSSLSSGPLRESVVLEPMSPAAPDVATSAVPQPAAEARGRGLG